ncbi:DUF397 domain-containing protein [Actinomadura meridiana]|uniref:DUF397 domain-containing protein n=1 Tax=Actinomadura meridiana TaxID=559626 RepID=UPI0031F14694
MGHGAMKKLTWRKSSYSGANGGTCTELARSPDGTIAVRDSKNPNVPHHKFSAGEMAELIEKIRRGEFDLT